MESIIYQLPIQEKILLIDSSKIIFDNNPSPKLLKYGFNSSVDLLDLTAITSVSYYKVGLQFDFDRTDNDGIVVIGKKILGVGNLNQTFFEFWEILSLFGLLNSAPFIKSNKMNIVKEINSIYDKNYASDSKKKQVETYLHKFSDVDIDENAFIQLFITELPTILKSQKIESNLILQLFEIQTETLVELIYFLSSYYTDSYLVKPSVVSDLSNSRYLVLTGLKQNIKFDYDAKLKNNLYLLSIGLKNIPTNFVNTIQCFNSKLLPEKFHTYYKIKSYLDTKVYEGATYDNMIKIQNQNTSKWFQNFFKNDKINTILSTAIDTSDTTCRRYTDLLKMY